MCLCVSLDSSSDDESVSERVTTSNTEQQADLIPTPTPVLTPTPELSLRVPTPETADSSVPVYTSDDVPVSSAGDVDADESSDQVVADIAAFYENITEPIVSGSEEPQQAQPQEQQQREETQNERIDEDHVHDHSDVDVLPSSRPQCTTFSHYLSRDTFLKLPMSRVFRSLS